MWGHNQSCPHNPCCLWPHMAESRLHNPCRLGGVKSGEGVPSGHTACILLGPTSGQIGYITHTVLRVHQVETESKSSYITRAIFLAHVETHWLHNPRFAQSQQNEKR